MRLKNSLVGLAVVLSTVSLVGCSAPSSSNQPQPTEYSSSDLQARNLYLDSVATESGITDPPEVDLVRFVDEAEWAEVHIECMTSSGFPVAFLSDGEGIDASAVPEAQRLDGGPFQIAKYICEAKYTLNPAASAQLNESQLGHLYDWYVSESVPCLEAHDVTVAAPPSKQTFIQTYFSSEGWYPYASVDTETISDELWSSLNAACPQSPENGVLSG